MARYIDADRLLNEVTGNGGVFVYGIDTIKAFISRITAQPSADVQEVKHGHWIKSGKPHDYDITCSLCGDVGEYGLETEDAVNDYYYCTNCGAKMDGGNNG